MKKKLFLVGMLAMVLVFGLVVAGCKDTNSDGGGLEAAEMIMQNLSAHGQ